MPGKLGTKEFEIFQIELAKSVKGRDSTIISVNFQETGWGPDCDCGGIQEEYRLYAHQFIENDDGSVRVAEMHRGQFIRHCSRCGYTEA